jgi:hypothetical protein
MEGYALDLDCSDNMKLFNFIKNNLNYKKLIIEFRVSGEPSWIHVSFKEGNNTKECLEAIKVKGITKYIKI